VIEAVSVWEAPARRRWSGIGRTRPASPSAPRRAAAHTRNRLAREDLDAPARAPLGDRSNGRFAA
jgi:hypothetical protein